MLIYSKQRGREFGELVPIIALATITIALAILSRPRLLGWTAFLTEMFVMTFCSTIVYLVNNLSDLRRELFSRVFRHRNLTNMSREVGSDYSIVFHDEDTFRCDSVVALLALIIHENAGVGV